MAAMGETLDHELGSLMGFSKEEPMYASTLRCSKTTPTFWPNEALNPVFLRTRVKRNLLRRTVVRHLSPKTMYCESDIISSVKEVYYGSIMCTVIYNTDLVNSCSKKQRYKIITLAILSPAHVAGRWQRGGSSPLSLWLVTPLTVFLHKVHHGLCASVCTLPSARYCW